VLTFFKLALAYQDVGSQNGVLKKTGIQSISVIKKILVKTQLYLEMLGNHRGAFRFFPQCSVQKNMFGDKVYHFIESPLCEPMSTMLKVGNVALSFNW
jgi:phage pi2 protein 07